MTSAVEGTPAIGNQKSEQRRGYSCRDGDNGEVRILDTHRGIGASQVVLLIKSRLPKQET